jgi:hypothetical protein
MGNATLIAVPAPRDDHQTLVEIAHGPGVVVRDVLVDHVRRLARGEEGRPVVVDGQRFEHLVVEELLDVSAGPAARGE